MANYNGPKTTYNKDEVFGAIKMDDGLRVVFDECVVVDCGESHVIAYGWASKVNGCSNPGETGWKFTPQLIAVRINKKTTEREYNGKKYIDESHPGGLAFIKQAESMKAAPCFSAVLDGSMDVDVSGIILTGKKVDGSTPSEKEMSYITEFIAPIAALGKLERLEGVKLPEGKSGKGGYGTGGGQKESAKLADRVAFLKAITTKENADLEAILSVVYGETAEQNKLHLIAHLLENLFS